MPCKILTSPLTEAFTGDGGAVAEFRSQRFHESGSPQIIVKQFIHQTGYIFEVASPVYKILIVSGAVGDVKIIAAAAVELGIDPVQGKRHDG